MSKHDRNVAIAQRLISEGNIPHVPEDGSDELGPEWDSFVEDIAKALDDATKSSADTIERMRRALEQIAAHGRDRRPVITVNKLQTMARNALESVPLDSASRVNPEADVDAILDALAWSGDRLDMTKSRMAIAAVLSASRASGGEMAKSEKRKRCDCCPDGADTL